MRVIETIFSFMILTNVINLCPDDPLCQNCSLSSTGFWCEFCYQSIYNSTTRKCDKNVPIRVENCAKYKDIGSEVVCSLCEQGYSWINDVCVKCNVENCAYCTRGEGCHGCFNGLTPKLVDGKIVCSADEKCNIANCSICDFDTDHESLCSLCNQGFGVDMYTGLCLPASDNCWFTRSNLNGCIMCRNGFYITHDSKCKPNPAEASSASPILAPTRVKTIRRSSTKATSIPL